MYSSPSRHNSPYNQNSSQFPQEQLHEDLTKYLNDSAHHEIYSDKLKKQIVLAQIESINTQLSNFCKEKIGNLALGGDKSEDQWNQIQKTIKLVKSLLSFIHRDGQAKKDLNSKLRKSQQQLNRLANTIEKLTRQKKTFEKQKENLELKIKSLQRQFKEDMQKIKKQKEETDKRFNQILSRQNQYKNEFRKNQQIISQLQQKLKTKTTDKGNVKNTFQKIEEVKNYGPALILSNYENEFNHFFVNNFEVTYKTIVEQNEYLKKCLQSVYQELHSLLEVKKQIIKKRKGFESALQSDAFELQNLKPESFNLPKQFSKDAISRLNENLLKFKQAIKINDLVNDKVQDQKVNCINNVKNLINNYKDIVEGQDKLINRIVLKSKQYKSNEISNIENKYSRTLEEDDLQKSRKFLEEQRQILLSRNKELEMTRKAMKNTMKKAEQQKKIFNKKRTETNEQLQMLKKNIQKIPAIVQEQLGNMM